MSYNNLLGYFDSNPCTLPDLKILNVGNQYFIPPTGLYFDAIFHDFPNLNTLQINRGAWRLRFKVLCSKLVTFQSSFSKVTISGNLYNGSILAPNLQNLYLNGITLHQQILINISIINIFKVPQLRIVDLSSNQISTIDEKDAMILNKISYLDLRHNHLVSLTSLQQLRNIKVLLLGGNKIKIVPKSFISNKPSLSTLDLHNNLFICDCNIERFKKWILTDKVVAMWNNFSDGNGYTCTSPYLLKGMSITQIDLDCSTQAVQYILVSTACFTFLIIIAILGVRYRWRIRYRFFLLFNRRNHPNYLVNNNEAPEDYENEEGFPLYDAYVTYHNDDEDWVDEELLPNIEEGDEPFRLCLKTRDIRGGRLKLNELSLRIQRSRKIVVILSPQFVKDNWCYFELNMAHQKAIEESYKALIFIVRERIPNDRLTLVLRQLFCRVQCFKWPADGYEQHLFWQCLREELKKPVLIDRRFNI